MALVPIQQDAAQGPAFMGIELVELETFIAVAQAESFSLAAQRLHVSQPTVTGRIQRLENALGSKLLRRTTRRVATTPDGAVLLVEAVEVLSKLRLLVNGFKTRARLARQCVVVAATPTLAALTLPSIIQAYSKKYPDVEIELRDLHYADVLNGLENGMVDLGVLALEADDARFPFEPLWTDNMVLVIPHGHPLTGTRQVGAEELSRHMVITIEQHQGLRARIAAALHARGLSLPPSKVVANLNTLLGMLDAGMGVTLLPRSMVNRRIMEKHTLVEIDGIDLTRRFGIVLSPRAQLGTAGQSFFSFLQASTPDLVAKAGLR